MIFPNVRDAIISGKTIKKLKIPMYIPILAGGILPASIVYGMERIDAHAMPTMLMDKKSKLGSWMKFTEISPMPPKTKHTVCVNLFPIFPTTKGIAKEKRNVTKFNMAEVVFANSSPWENCNNSFDPSTPLTLPPKIFTATPVP